MNPLDKQLKRDIVVIITLLIIIIILMIFKP